MPRVRSFWYAFSRSYHLTLSCGNKDKAKLYWFVLKHVYLTTEHTQSGGLLAIPSLPRH